MSYILQALKKAEEERGASPRAVPTPRPLPPMTRARWPWLAGGVIALAGVSGAFTLWMRGLAPRSDLAPVVSAVPAAQPVRAEPVVVDPPAARVPPLAPRVEQPTP